VGRAGFTLLETMVAVAVLATAMVAVLAVCVQLQDARLRALRSQAAALTLSDRLADVAAFGTNRLESRQGTRETPGGDWRWRVDVADTALPGISRVTVDVAPDTSDGQGGAVQAEAAAGRAREEKTVTVFAGRR
jgi:general secretion pathway protein I